MVKSELVKSNGVLHDLTMTRMTIMLKFQEITRMVPKVLEFVKIGPLMILMKI